MSKGSLPTLSYLQILVKLHFVPCHDHIEFILEATELQTARMVRWLRALHAHWVGTGQPGLRPMLSHSLLQSLQPLLPIH